MAGIRVVGAGSGILVAGEEVEGSGILVAGEEVEGSGIQVEASGILEAGLGTAGL